MTKSISNTIYQPGSSTHPSIRFRDTIHDARSGRDVNFLEMLEFNPALLGLSLWLAGVYDTTDSFIQISHEAEGLPPHIAVAYIECRLTSFVVHRVSDIIKEGD
jgi:hypothetical protein